MSSLLKSKYGTTFSPLEREILRTLKDQDMIAEDLYKLLNKPLATIRNSLYNMIAKGIIIKYQNPLGKVGRPYTFFSLQNTSLIDEGILND